MKAIRNLKGVRHKNGRGKCAIKHCHRDLDGSSIAIKLDGRLALVDTCAKHAKQVGKAKDKYRGVLLAK